MGLDKTGFTLLENELNERKRQIREAYQNKKAEAVAQKINNLFSTGKQREQDIENINRNYDLGNFKDSVETPMKQQEQNVFQDWGGSREEAFKTMSSYEKELKDNQTSKPTKETEAEFKGRMQEHFSQRGTRDKGRGRS